MSVSGAISTNLLSALRKKNSYVKLLRFDNLTGWFLLMFPGLYGVLISDRSYAAAKIYCSLLLVVVGSFIARSAGCIINDLTDRRFDGLVNRTRKRPLASGDLSVESALILLFALVVLGSLIALIFLNLTTILMLMVVLPLVVIYPFVKRYTHFAQVFLGFVFGSGGVIGNALVMDRVNMPAVIFYIGCVFWVVGYDTVYAHQDKKDDQKIGLKSMAILVGDRTSYFLYYIYNAAVFMWVVAIFLSKLNLISLVFVLVSWLMLSNQSTGTDFNDPLCCKMAFQNHLKVGVVMFMGLLLGRIFV